MRIIYPFTQVVGAAAVLLGLYWLVGLAVTFVVGGVGLLAGSVLVEYAAHRAPRPAPRGDA